jgi:hypothetical protein
MWWAQQTHRMQNMSLLPETFRLSTGKKKVGRGIISIYVIRETDKSTYSIANNNFVSKLS